MLTSFLARHNVPLSTTISPVRYASVGSNVPLNCVNALSASGAPTTINLLSDDTATPNPYPLLSAVASVADNVCISVNANVGVRESLSFGRVFSRIRQSPGLVSCRRGATSFYSLRVAF